MEPSSLQLYAMQLGRDALLEKILGLVAGEPVAELWTEALAALDNKILYEGMLDDLGGVKEDG